MRLVPKETPSRGASRILNVKAQVPFHRQPSCFLQHRFRDTKTVGHEGSARWRAVPPTTMALRALCR